MRQSNINGVIASCAIHGTLVAAILFVTTQRGIERTDVRADKFDPPPNVVWLSVPGRGGGGGGGGLQDPTPARAAKVKGADASAMPSAARATDATEKPKPSEPLPDIPVQMLGASDLTKMGLIEAGADSLSHGMGTDGGVGTGRGKGAGPGIDDGVGPGRGGNTGGDVYEPGNGVTMPVAVHQEKPRYTSEAMRARIQGAVVVECVVQPSGRCTRLRVVRSLDPRLGLDQQALQAAAAWRFAPGTRLGKPVSVVVTIQLGFSIH